MSIENIYDKKLEYKKNNEKDAYYSQTPKGLCNCREFASNSIMQVFSTVLR